MKPLLPPWTGPAGRGATPLSAAAASASCFWISPSMSSIPPSRRSSRSHGLVQGLLAALARRRKARLSRLELLAGPGELGPARGDGVAGGPDPGDGLPGVISKVADAVDDLGVLRLDRLEVLEAAERVVEPVGVEDDGDRARVVGLVDGDEALLQRLHRAGQALAQDLQLGGRLLELSFGLVELGLHRRLAVAQCGDLADQLVDLIVVALDLGAEDALLLLHLAERGLLLVELLLQGVGRRGDGEAEDDHERREQREGRERESRGVSAHGRGRGVHQRLRAAPE